MAAVGSWSVADWRAFVIWPMFIRLNFPSFKSPPVEMISSCNRFWSPPITTSRAKAITAGSVSAVSATTRAVRRCKPFLLAGDQTSARSKRNDICTRRWLRCASTTSSRPSTTLWSKVIGRILPVCGCANPSAQAAQLPVNAGSS